jgi:hypothetical protein
VSRLRLAVGHAGGGPGHNGLHITSADDPAA